MSFVHPLYEVGGVDCSKYQYPINFDTLDPRISFFGARIGHASAIDDGIDHTYPGYMLNMRARKKPRLSYWYWKPEISNDKQFYALEPVVKADWPEMGVYVDVEENFTGLPKGNVRARLNEFLIGIDSIIPVNAGELTGLYTGIAFWNNNVDGLYGVSVGAAFMGESMFAWESDASKAAFVALVEQLRAWNFQFVDCQVHTEHLERFGAKECGRRSFLVLLREALAVPAEPGPWRLGGPSPIVPEGAAAREGEAE